MNAAAELAREALKAPAIREQIKASLREQSSQAPANDVHLVEHLIDAREAAEILGTPAGAVRAAAFRKTIPQRPRRPPAPVPSQRTARRCADKLKSPVQPINEIVNGKRGITAEMAWIFAGAFGTTPEFWTNLQASYDLARARPQKTIARVAVR